jgi:hypothetical protein
MIQVTMSPRKRAARGFARRQNQGYLLHAIHRLRRPFREQLPKDTSLFPEKINGRGDKFFVYFGGAENAIGFMDGYNVYAHII